MPSHQQVLSRINGSQDPPLLVPATLTRSTDAPELAREADAPAISTLLRELLGERWGSLELIEDRMAKGAAFVVRSGTEIVAALILSPESHMYSCLVECLAVEPNAQRRGIGQKLIEQAKFFCREHGIGVLYVISANVYKAAGFYLKCGFYGRVNPHSFKGLMSIG